jgi:hypothetical protein
MGQPRETVSMFAGIADVLARIAPEAVAVAIVSIVFKLLRYALGETGRWDRLMVVVMPLLNLVVLVVLVLIVVAVWWLVADGGALLLLHGSGRT